MDIIFLGNTQLITMEKIDCIRISHVGYEYFHMIFSHKDWERIKAYPEKGLIFSHEIPDVYLLLLYARKSGWSLDERTDKVGIYYRKIIKYMAEEGIPMPNPDAKISIFD